jgi:hypothetical protein
MPQLWPIYSRAYFYTFHHLAGVAPIQIMFNSTVMIFAEIAFFNVALQYAVVRRINSSAELCEIRQILRRLLGLASFP